MAMKSQGSGGDSLRKAFGKYFYKNPRVPGKIEKVISKEGRDGPGSEHHIISINPATIGTSPEFEPSYKVFLNTSDGEGLPPEYKKNNKIAFRRDATRAGIAINDSIEPITDEEYNELRAGIKNVFTEHLDTFLSDELRDEVQELKQEHKEVTIKVKKGRELASACKIKINDLSDKIKIGKAEIKEQTLEKARIKAACRQREERVSEDEKRLERELSRLGMDSSFSQDSKELETISIAALKEKIGPEFQDKVITVCFLASLLDGSMVLMNGGVGTGKTYATEQITKKLGGKFKKVAVRPGWLDSTDLLGYFDPLQKVFRPGEFADSLQRANTQPGQLHVFCLDELNISNMENYGSDILSALGTSTRNIPLYPQFLFNSLREEQSSISNIKEVERTPEQKRRFKELAEILAKYPWEIDIPKTFLVTGTLNTDFSTYSLSPKILDRSYIIPFAPPKDFTRNTSTEFSKFNIDLDELRTNFQEEKTRDFNDGYHSFGLENSYRLIESKTAIEKVVELLGEDVALAQAIFALTRLLPRIQASSDSSQASEAIETHIEKPCDAGFEEKLHGWTWLKNRLNTLKAHENLELNHDNLWSRDLLDSETTVQQSSVVSPTKSRERSSSGMKIGPGAAVGRSRKAPTNTTRKVPNTNTTRKVPNNPRRRRVDPD
jgi:hypothetical protein